MAQTTPGARSRFAARVARDFRANKWKYLMILPVLVYLAVFAYRPMYGLQIAFKNYRPTRGIAGSQWVGFLWFEKFFTDPYFWRLLRNTFVLSGLDILFGFPAPILLALLLNELRSSAFKRTVQTITYMPYFISLVVMCSLLKIYSQENGVFSQIIQMFGGQAQNLTISPPAYRPIYIGSGIWQHIGWNSIIYLAALSGIDQEQYEAAHRRGQPFQAAAPHHAAWHPAHHHDPVRAAHGQHPQRGYEKVLLTHTPSTYEVADVFSTPHLPHGPGEPAVFPVHCGWPVQYDGEHPVPSVGQLFSRRTTQSALF